MTNLLETYTNSANTTLNGAIDGVVTSITVASATGYPNYGQYRILIDAEIMLVTGGQGTTTWTVTRGVENSAITSHANGATVRFIVTAASLLELQWKDKIVTPGTTIHPLDDEFDDGVLDSSWVRVDNPSEASTCTWTEYGDVLSVKNTSVDFSGRYHALLKPLNGRTYPITIEAATRHFSNYNTPYLMFGICFTDGTTYGAGKQIGTRSYVESGVGLGLIISTELDTGFNTEVGASTFGNYQVVGGPWFWRAIWSSPNTFQTWFSPDGVSWIQMGTNVSHTMTPTHVGIWISNWGTGGNRIGTVEYFRVYESNKAGNP